MKRLILLAALALLPVAAFADEGMWMIHALNQALEKKMQERGLQLSAGEIYNADAPGTTVSDAVVSLGFYCTASVISDEGLLITNHHCAYSDLFDLSTPEKKLPGGRLLGVLPPGRDSAPGEGSVLPEAGPGRDGRGGGRVGFADRPGRALRLAEAHLHPGAPLRRAHRPGGLAELDVGGGEVLPGPLHHLQGHPPGGRPAGVHRGLRRRRGQLGMAAAQGRFRPVPHL